MKNEKELSEDILKELEGLAPNLSRLNKADDGFRVPPAYFREMERELAGKLGVGQKRQPVFGRFLSSLARVLEHRTAYRLAAIGLVVAAGVWLLWPAGSTRDVAMDEVSVEELHAYISDNLDDFEMDLLYELASSEGSETELNIPSDFSEGEEFDQYLDEMIDDLDLSDLEDLL